MLFEFRFVDITLLEQCVGIRREKLLIQVFLSTAVIWPQLGADEIIQFAGRIAVGHEAVIFGRVAVESGMQLPGSGSAGCLFNENDIDECAFATNVEARSRATDHLDAGDDTCLDSLHRGTNVIRLAGNAFAVNQDLVSAGAETAFFLLIAAASIVRYQSRPTRYPAQHICGGHRRIGFEKTGLVGNRGAVG